MSESINLTDLPKGYRWRARRDYLGSPYLELQERRWWSWKKVGAAPMDLYIAMGQSVEKAAEVAAEHAWKCYVDRRDKRRRLDEITRRINR